MENIFLRTLRLPYKTFIEPHSKNEDERHSEAMLNAMISLILLIVLCVSPVSLCTIIFAGILLLSRKGHVLLASYAFIGIYFLATTYSLYRFGMESPAVMLHYAVVITISKVLINTRFGVFMTTAITIALMGVGVFQENVVTAIESSMAYLFIMTLLWLSNRGKNCLFERKSMELYRFAEFGKFSSGIFHDLINPLTSISLIMEKLRGDNQKSRDEALEQIDVAIRASKRMESFLRTAKKQLRLEDHECLFCIRRETEEAITLLEYKKRLLGIEIDVNMPEDYEIYGSPLKFFQIISNLLSNAIDSYEGCKDRDAGARKVVICAEKRLEQIEISVVDYGCGIPDNVQSSIFNPFFTTKRSLGGIGIGLSMTKRTIEKDFKGTISVNSKCGQGSVFAIALPLRKTTGKK